MMMRRGRAREPSLPCCDDPGVVVYSLFFSFLFAGGVSLGKRGARSAHERSDGVMGVCVCVRVYVWNKYFSTFLHTSCELLFYAERKERQVEDDQRFYIHVKAALFFLLSILIVPHIGVRMYFHARRASHIDYFIKMTHLR